MSSLLQMTNGWELYELAVRKIVVEKKTRSLVEFRQLNKMLHLSANLSYKFLEKEKILSNSQLTAIQFISETSKQLESYFSI
jgi:hypothetical protein